MTKYTSLATPLVDSVYETQKNYITTSCSGEDEVWIFFSGNGLYFPNDEKTFQEVVIDQNRYEWSSLAEHVKERAKKIIFVRDVYKRWYLDGINSSCKDPNELIALLREMTKDRTIVTVGNSAGAYMALMVGTALNAKYIYAFNPQVTLAKVDPNDHPLVRTYANTEKISFFDIRNQIQNSNSHIFFFYAAYNDDDVFHASITKGKNVHFFPFREYLHGKTVLAVNYKELFLHPEKLIELKMKEPVSARKFLFLTAGHKAPIYYIKSVWTRGIRKLRKR